jgi:hypothetical protein
MQGWNHLQTRLSYRLNADRKGQVPGSRHLTSSDSRVSQHATISSFVQHISSSRFHDKSSFRRRRSFGRSSSRRAAAPMPLSSVSLRDPVSGGEIGRTMCCNAWVPLSFSDDERTRQDKDKSSRRGNEQTVLKACEHGRIRASTWRDLRVGANTWKEVRNASKSLRDHRKMPTSKRTTRGKLETQQRSATSATVTP